MSSIRPLVQGIYVPVLSFFNEDEDQTLDLETHKKHILWMAQSGVHGFLLQGSTAEAVALTPVERKLIIRATRDILDQHHFTHIPLIAGASGQTTRESVAYARDAQEAGADYIICLPPSYFAGSMTKAALESYYLEVADKSPLPVMIYSYPGASSGLELSSDSIAVLAKHKNLVGIKQTDHNVGKMARVVYQNPGFIVLGGASDYLLGALAVGAAGTITGMANLTPRACVRIWELFRKGDLKEAQTLQGELSVAEWGILIGGIPGIKFAAKKFLGRGGVPRRPVPECSEEVQVKIYKSLKGMVAYEGKLAADAKS